MLIIISVVMLIILYNYNKNSTIVIKVVLRSCLNHSHYTHKHSIKSLDSTIEIVASFFNSNASFKNSNAFNEKFHIVNKLVNYLFTLYSYKIIVLLLLNFPIKSSENFKM